MSHQLNVTIPDLETLVELESRVPVAAIGSRVIAAHVTDTRPKGEDTATSTVRGVVAGAFAQKLAKAMAAEEKEVLATHQAIQTAAGAALDGVGGALGVTRDEGETDEALRERLFACNTIESKPLRAQLGKAFSAILDDLTKQPGAVRSLVEATSAEMSNV